MGIIIILLGFFTTSNPSLSKTEKFNEAQIKSIIDAHNFWRQDVGVSEKLVWSDQLAKVAESWAVSLKNRGCAFEHNMDHELGENLFIGTKGYFTAKDVIDAWASEKDYYNYKKNTCDPGKMCGHYTQIIWSTTREVGCAKVTCDEMDIWVCNYDPPGNWTGQRPY